MFVKLKAGGYSFDENITDQKVVAIPTGNGGIVVRLSELIRVGFIQPDYIGSIQCDPNEGASGTRFFTEDEFEAIEPTMVNCSSSNVGKGWEGFYEQAPIKKSKFRNR